MAPIFSLKKFFIFLLFLFLLIPLALAIVSIGGIVIRVIVAPTIKANYYFVNQTLGPVQIFYIAWENSGSIDCDVLPRITFFNSSNHSVYTAWIKKGGIPPGGGEDWIFYTSLPPGNYTAIVRVLYCKELFEYGPYSFEVKNYSLPKHGFLKIVGNKTFEDYVEITLTSNETLSDVAIIPINYPLAWVFTSSLINEIKAGEKVKVKLFYEPTIWRETFVKVKAITLDGSYEDEKEILLKKEVGILEKILNFLKSIFPI